MEFSYRIREQRKNRSGVKSSAQFCIICLDTDTKLYPMNKHNLDIKFQHLIGISLQIEGNFAPQFCSECAQRLSSSSGLRDKALRSYHLLAELVKNHPELTTQDVKTINRTAHQLTSNITKRTFQPDHCDLFLIHVEEGVKIEEKCVENKANVSENQKTEVKIDFEPKNEAFNDIKSDSDDDFLIDNTFNDSVKSDGENEELLNEERAKELSNETDSDWDFLRDSDISNSDEEVVNSKNVKVKNASIKSKLSGDQVSKSKIKNNIIKPKISSNLKKKNDRNSKENENKATKKRGRLKQESKKPGRPENEEALKLFKITILSHEEQLAEILKRKDMENFKNSPYKCMKCYKVFCSVPTYESHMERHTDKFGPVECTVCGMRVKNQTQLRHHTNKNHRTQYTCTECPYVTHHKESAVSHAQWHKGAKFKCPHCDEEYSKKTSYFSHLRIWHPTDVVCTLCGFSFINERGLNMHMNLKHRFDDAQSAAGPLCAPCDIRFASQTAYTQHLEVSPKHANYEGNKRNTPRYRQLRIVKPLHKPKAEPRMIECEQCGMQLQGYKMYRSHFSRFHPDESRTQYPPSSQRRFLCEQCGRGFKHRCLLRDHMLLVHSSKKEFQCDACKKTFSLKGNLITHMKTHSESQPTHACPICGKQFTNKANTNRHIWTHRDLKPYKCHACEKTFVNASSRRSHVLHAHLKQPWPKKTRGPRQRASRARHTKEAVCGTIWPKAELSTAPIEFHS